MNVMLLMAALYFSQISGVIQSGIVTGRVLDAAGKPVVSMRVAAAELPRPGNTLESSNVLAAITQTDDSGRYRLENVPPGRYHILAGMVDYPTYYPGVTESESAKVVEIGAGKSVEGLDFSLARPKGVKVSGRLAGGSTVASIPVTLFSVAGSTLQTNSRTNGSFEFDSVPLGSYMVRVPGYEAMNLKIDGKDLSVDLTLVNSAPGVRVSGALVGNPSGLLAPRTVTLTPVFVPAGVAGNVSSLGGALGATSGVLETFVRDDDTFEFPAVPPGAYTLRSLPVVAGTRPHVAVGTQDIHGLELPVPFQMNIAGRVLLDGRDFTSAAIVESHQGSFTMSTSVRPDGTFRLRLTEGDNQIAVARLPSELAVASITYGANDITRAPLRIDSSTVPEEILVTIERTASNLSADGVKVNQRALTGVEVVGRASVIDAQGKAFPLMPANLSVTFKRPNGAGGSAAIRIDGTFGVPLPEELYMVSVNNVAAPYRVKSISSGRTDLLKEPLEVTSRETPATIEIILEYKPAVTP